MSEASVRSSKIARWGNSAAVRINAAALEHAHLQVDDVVEVVARDDEIVIRRQRPKVTMSELLATFDPGRHAHDLTFDAEPAGNETHE
jgi:antitoxin component of MazEF toxin-antitoxin module